MAEAFLRKHAPHIQVNSAGTKPANKPNPAVVQAMLEIGIRIDATPKPLFPDMIQDSDMVVNMGCVDKESCPALFVNNVENWAVSDPKGKSLDDVRAIRDSIESKVKSMAERRY